MTTIAINNRCISVENVTCENEVLKESHPYYGVIPIPGFIPGKPIIKIIETKSYTVTISSVFWETIYSATQSPSHLAFIIEEDVFRGNIVIKQSDRDVLVAQIFPSDYPKERTTQAHLEDK